MIASLDYVFGILFAMWNVLWSGGVRRFLLWGCRTYFDMGLRSSELFSSCLLGFAESIIYQPVALLAAGSAQVFTTSRTLNKARLGFLEFREVFNKKARQNAIDSCVVYYGLY